MTEYVSLNTKCQHDPHSFIQALNVTLVMTKRYRFALLMNNLDQLMSFC